MRAAFAAVLAVAVASSAGAETTQDLTTATPISGTWSYAPTSDGTEASFANAVGTTQLWIHCTLATRRVTIAKAATAAAQSLNVWTSSLSRSVGANFNPATGRLTIDLGASDPLLDALANSRGRVGFVAGAQPPLVLPLWPEAAHVIEDCRV